MPVTRSPGEDGGAESQTPLWPPPKIVTGRPRITPTEEILLSKSTGVEDEGNNDFLIVSMLYFRSPDVLMMFRAQQKVRKPEAIVAL